MSVVPQSTAAVISFNQSDFIVQCLESVRLQTVPPSLVVYVDDGSEDDSFEIGSTFIEANFPRSVLIRHPEPIGLCRSLNEALLASEGEYFQEIAADDYWFPRKTELQIAALRGSPAALVYGDAELVDVDSNPIGQTFLERFIPDGVPEDNNILRTLLRRNFLPGMSVMLRRQALLDVGGWDERLFYEDWDMWLRLASRWPILHHPEVVSAYRLVPNSMSNSRVDEMWLSKLAIAARWSGRSARADLGWLRRTAPVTMRRTFHGDWRYLRAWCRLLEAVVVQRRALGRS